MKSFINVVNNEGKLSRFQSSARAFALLKLLLSERSKVNNEATKEEMKREGRRQDKTRHSLARSEWGYKLSRTM